MESILIIDNEKSLRELLRLSLEADGYEVHTSEDGLSGLEIYDQFRPAIVITDIKMPGIDGMEVLRRLKKIDPDVEVIVITGYAKTELAVQALQLEASDFIDKPISESALRVALRRASKKISMRRKLRDHVANLEKEVQEATIEIRKRNDFEHQLIQTSMDGIIANDPAGNIIKFNEGACRICGYAIEEVIRHKSVTQLYPPGEARNIKRKIYGPEYGGPGHLVNYETEVVAKDGRTVPILLSATLIYDGDEEVATVGFFKDLTEIRRLQEELLQKTRMAGIGEAIAEIAHGVKNILYGVQLGSFMVEKGMGGENSEKFHKGWRIMQQNIGRMSKFSLDMLNYTRKDLASQSLVQVNDLIADTCGSLTGEAEKNRVLLCQHLAPDLPVVWGNPEGLHTCLLNLLTNAIEAIPESASERLVEVRTGQTGSGSISLEVSDTGRGIGPELQKKMFKPLFSTKGAKGTGLGLAITEKIIGEHGGRIEVISVPQHGTTFRLILPAGEGASAEKCDGAGNQPD